ncbi:tail fiber assembly protein [Rahnella sp. PAMC 25559]
MLQAWQKYRYSITKVDTALAPNISWSVAPTL